MSGPGTAICMFLASFQFKCAYLCCMLVWLIVLCVVLIICHCKDQDLCLVKLQFNNENWLFSEQVIFLTSQSLGLA